jgi:hypothetical protein
MCRNAMIGDGRGEAQHRRVVGRGGLHGHTRSPHVMCSHARHRLVKAWLWIRKRRSDKAGWISQNPARNGFRRIQRGTDVAGCDMRRILRIQRACKIRFGRASICKSNAQRETRCKIQIIHDCSRIDYQVLLKAPAFSFMLRFQRAADSHKQCIKSNTEWISQNPTQKGFRRTQRGADFAEPNAGWISHN